MTKDLALPGPDVPIIDESRLMAEFGGDVEILAELRDLFLDHVPPLFEDILEAVKSNDTAVLADSAHSLKGACSTYGAPRLSMLCRDVEQWAREGDMESINALMSHVEKEYYALYQAIKNIGAQEPAGV